MQSAQWRARDVARKNDLSQIQTAIITSQQDKRTWPAMATSWTGTKASEGISIWTIADLLVDAWMTQVPMDPNKSNSFYWLGKDNQITGWNYGYLVTTRNAVKNGGFVLMAKTEVEWSSNWITCTGTTTKTGAAALAEWIFVTGVDLKNVTTCSSFVKTGTTTACGISSDWTCTYNDEAQLRYILVY